MIPTSRVAAVLLATLAACAVDASAEVTPTDTSFFNLGCGDFRAVDLARLDYRLKDATAEGKKGVGDLDNYHTIPARNEMQKSVPHANTVIGNLDFSLRHSPNHHEALRLLIRYELNGGNLLSYPNARCYLDWARRFMPDDATVLLYGGNYFWKKGERERARAWYERALEIDADSADAHYNLGLLLVELKQYEKAREHARAAYGAGYPLPGLRNKLARVGYRLDANPPSPAATTKP